VSGTGGSGPGTTAVSAGAGIIFFRDTGAAFFIIFFTAMSDGEVNPLWQGGKQISLLGGAKQRFIP
jgi:hypothetical protein